MQTNTPPYYIENSTLSPEVLSWIQQQNLWNLWVPEDFGGLEAQLLEGLKTLQWLARSDGSLGWTVTLCAGANFFIGNLQPDFAASVFAEKSVIMGGSGGMFGTADRSNSSYQLNGHWRYATGAPYLTHFTLNAQLQSNGTPLNRRDGKPDVRSFVIPAEQVSVVDDWQTMGLKATATQSFIIEDVNAAAWQTFRYDQVYLGQPLYQLNFSVFADLTLWVNYIGMAEHLVAVTVQTQAKEQRNRLLAEINNANQQMEQRAQQCCALMERQIPLSDEQINEIHQSAAHSVAQISNAIIAFYPRLGIAAATETQEINRIFRDYFTATQHYIFTN